MRTTTAFVILASLALGACGGGGQTEPTQSEEALNNELQPAAPSPGAAGPGADASNQSVGNDSEQAAGNSQ